MSVHPHPFETPSLRRKDRLRGLVIVGLTFLLCLFVSAWARRRATPVFSAPPAPPSTVGVVGFPDHVDVVKTLARARQVTPRTLLRGITAENVSSDGTVGLAAQPPARVRYTFASAEGEGPQSLREPGTLARHPSCGTQAVVLRKDGMVAEPDAAEVACPEHPSESLPDPHCGVAQVWAHALALGVPKDKLARIEYYRAKAGPAWRFEAAHASGRFSLDGDCKRELDARDAINVGY
ncbi:MAG: hypothetical protein ABJB12_08080 [Pseudomonadota bacterium]